jgi:hypothetical protein
MQNADRLCTNTTTAPHRTATSIIIITHQHQHAEQDHSLTLDQHDQASVRQRWHCSSINIPNRHPQHIFPVLDQRQT